MLATLRQRRYYGLMAISLVVAIACVLAGTWQVARFNQKHHVNHELRSNNKDTLTDVSGALGPATGPTATGKTYEFRHITATGTYLSRSEALVRGQTVGGDVGYLVLTPLKTHSGVLLIVRGFVAQTQSARVTPTVPAAPAGEVTVTARLEPTDTKPDRLGQLPQNQVESINPIDQASRLRTPVWNAYAELLDNQPGTAGLTVIPDPDLSNPAGGADEPQHAAYVVQWYLFAALALALPFVLAAAERRREFEESGTGPTSPQPAGRQPSPPNPQAAGKPRRRQRKADLDDRLAGRR